MTEHIKRKHIRFEPDNHTLVWISKDCEGFEPQFVGLAHSESYGGCSFIVNQDIQVEVGTKLRLAVGNNAPLASEIRWIKKLYKRTYLMGAEILE
jgi:hypothetical protein